MRKDHHPAAPAAPGRFQLRLGCARSPDSAFQELQPGCSLRCFENFATYLKGILGLSEPDPVRNAYPGTKLSQGEGGSKDGSRKR